MYVVKSNRTENYVADSSRVADGALTFTGAQKSAMRFTDKNVAQTLCNTQDAGFLRVVKLVPKAKPAPADPLPVASTVAPTQGALIQVYRRSGSGDDLIKMTVVDVMQNGGYFVIVED